MRAVSEKPVIPIVILEDLEEVQPVAWYLYPPPRNLSYICPHCGRLWGRVIFKYELPPKVKSLGWHPVTPICPDHLDKLFELEAGSLQQTQAQWTEKTGRTQLLGPKAHAREFELIERYYQCHMNSPSHLHQ